MSKTDEPYADGQHPGDATGRDVLAWTKPDPDESYWHVAIAGFYCVVEHEQPDDDFHMLSIRMSGSEIKHGTEQEAKAACIPKLREVVSKLNAAIAAAQEAVDAPDP